MYISIIDSYMDTYVIFLGSINGIFNGHQRNQHSFLTYQIIKAHYRIRLHCTLSYDVCSGPN